MLTKSLHTVTAATNVARHMLSTARDGFYSHGAGAEYLAANALSVLGYDVNTVSPIIEDETVGKIIKACAKLLDEHKPITRRDVAAFERVMGPEGRI